MLKPEAQTIEYKSSWQEDYFIWLSGYANANGGTLYIGVNDDGYVIGVKDVKYLLDTLPNQINSYLGIIVSIEHGVVNDLGHNLKYGKNVPDDIAAKPDNLYVRGILTECALDDIDADPENTASVTADVQKLFDAAPGYVKQLRQSEDNRKRAKKQVQIWSNENPIYQNADGSLEYVWITVNAYSHGVPYHGAYYKRAGGTTHEITGHELTNFINDKVGMKWDAVPVKDVEIDHSALDYLREHALKRNRLTQKAVAVSDEILIKNLQILTNDGEYTRAAAMLFGNPENVVFGAYIRIGYFENGRLKYQDEIHGPLISQAQRAAEIIFDKYLKALVDIKGLQRTETYMTSEEILREVILNSVAHKNYPSNVPVQIKVFDDHITVMNEGFWPFDNLAVEDVYNEHSSFPANPLIDNGLFFAGAMDTWGQGFMLIKDECEKTEAPLPEIKATEKYVTVTIFGCKKYMELLKKDDNSILPGAAKRQADPAISQTELDRLLAFCKEAKSKKDIIGFMGSPNRSTFERNVLNPLIESGRLLRTRPESPKAPDQKYYTNPDA